MGAPPALFAVSKYGIFGTLPEDRSVELAWSGNGFGHPRAVVAVCF